MAWIFVDKEDGGSKEQMRSNMRSMMRGGQRSYGGSTATMRGDYNEGYRMGYKHCWEDKEDDWMDENPEYRRRRDSRGRYMQLKGNWGLR